MNLTQVDAVCKQAMLVKRQGHISEAMQMLWDCFRECSSDNSDEICFAALFKSLAKLYYIRRDFSKAEDLYFDAIEAFMCRGIEDEAKICLMHLGACCPEFIQSRFFDTYLWSLETGSYAGVPQDVATGIAQLGVELGVALYNARADRLESEAEQ